MYHIYSTAANSTEYVKYAEHGPRGINVMERSVLIKGGAGINQKHVQTPLGVHTAISDEDYEWLKDDYHFKQKVRNGYLAVRKSEVHPEVVAADMATRQFVRDATGNAIRGDAFPVSPNDFSDRQVAEGLTPVKPMDGKKGKKAA